MEGHWGHWHLAAAGRVGIVANQNGIESVHKSEKVIIGKADLKAETRVYVNSSLPKIGIFCGDKMARLKVRPKGDFDVAPSLPISYVGDGPITTEYVADARARIQASTKAVLEITDPSKYAVTDTARKTLEGRKLFVINADTDMPAMTSARSDRFL